MKAKLLTLLPPHFASPSFVHAAETPGSTAAKMLEASIASLTEEAGLLIEKHEDEPVPELK